MRLQAFRMRQRRRAGAGSGNAGIVVIQEIFGVNAGIRRKCDQLAEAVPA